MLESSFDVSVSVKYPPKAHGGVYLTLTIKVYEEKPENLVGPTSNATNAYDKAGKPYMTHRPGHHRVHGKPEGSQPAAPSITTTGQAAYSPR